MDRVGDRDGETQETEKDMGWEGAGRLQRNRRKRKQAGVYAFYLLVNNNQYSLNAYYVPDTEALVVSHSIFLWCDGS